MYDGKGYDKLSMINSRRAEPRSHTVQTAQGEYRRNRQHPLQVHEPQHKFEQPEVP